jgi:hypothetical protein
VIATIGLRLKLLLAAAIVVALGAAGVLTVNVIQTVTVEQARACSQEYASVQAGLDAYMAANNLSSVPASTGTTDMTAPVRLYTKAPTATDRSFVTNATTHWAYAWDDKGRVTAIISGPEGNVPPGCVVSG